MSTDRPIIFTAESVRAILVDRKTQTRRLYRARPGDNMDDSHGPLFALPSPYGSPGDRLWVREAWGVGTRPCAVRGWYDGIEYRADERDPIQLRECIPDDFDEDAKKGWRSPLYMPRWASRLTLEVAEVRMQRLHEISEADASVEGVDEIRAKTPTALDAYRMRRNDINGKRRRREYLELGDPGYGVGGRNYKTVIDESASWASNPFVWSLTFRRVA